MTEFTQTRVRFNMEEGVLIAHVVAQRVLQEPMLTEIQEAILEQLPNARRGLLIDCASVTGAVTSQFVGLFLHLRKTCKGRGLQLGLCNVGGNIMTVLKITNLTSVLPTFENIEDAG